MKNRANILHLFIITAAVLITGCSAVFTPVKKPLAVNGIIDLRQWDFEKQGRVELSGEWKFIWASDSNDFSRRDYDDSGWQNLRVPGAWDPATGSSYGLGWMRLRVLMPADSDKKPAGYLAIEQLIEIFSAYEMYINGELIISNGRVSADAAGEVPDNSPRIIPMTIKQGEEVLDIAVRVSNHNFTYIGFHGSPAIGLTRELHSNFISDKSKNFLVLGIVIMMIVYHLMLWIARRDDTTSLVFAMWCLAPLMRLFYIANVSGMLFPDINTFDLHHRFSFLSLPFSLMFMSTFYSSLFPEEFSKKILRIFQAIGAVTFVIIAATPASIFTKLMIPLELAMLLVVIWAIYSLVRALVNKKQEALIILLSMVVFLVTVTNDLVYSFGYINTGFYSQTGFIFLIFCQSTALSLRFARTYRTADHLSRYLQDEVERKTEDLTLRTIEAEDAKKEIEKVNSKLIEMDNYKNIFFQNITHEFRTPLTLIIGYMERSLQAADDENSELVRQHRTVLSNSYRLLRLINQLLDISKFDENMMKLNEGPCDAVEFMRSIKSSFDPAALKKNIGYTFTADTGRFLVMMDREKVEKILLNILSNAFKFTGDGGTISVDLTTAGKNFTVSIKDSGTGIDEPMIGRIFDRFYQVEQTTTRTREGTGIGLSLVREYINLYNGTIDVRSRKDEGSEFVITLPLRIVENPEYVTIGSSSVSREAAAVYTSDAETLQNRSVINDDTQSFKELKTVLIVDDNPDIRGYVRDILSPFYNVIEEENGLGGLKKATRHKPDIIISDIMMPQMDGYQMLAQIRENPKTAHIPVILLTAKSTEDEKIEGLDAGADDYIAKPFSDRELLARTRSLIRLHEYQRIIAERNSEIEADLEIAREIQSKLILEAHKTRGMKNFHVLFMPMDKVAGDFYNFHETETCVKIFIADVSGHGVAAAFLALITRNELDNSISSDNNTTSVLGHLNNVISQYAVKCNFVTAFYCIYKKDTGMLTYCRAGHNPPLLYRPSDRSVTELDTLGRALGFFPDIVFEEKQLYLEKGDRLIFYTDGIIEARNSDGEMYELERFVTFIQQSSGCSPSELSERLMDDITRFSGSSSFDDDVTLLVYDIE